MRDAARSCATEETAVASPNHNGGRNVALPADQEPSWRPEDEPLPRFVSRDTDDDRDYRAWRDHDPRDDDRRGANSYGERQRDERHASTGRYGETERRGAGRYGDDGRHRDARHHGDDRR